MKIKIFFHNNCFDGVASAAVFGAFYRECINPESQQIYEGLAHKAGQMFEEASFDGDENAIVDFKYCGLITTKVHFSTLAMKRTFTKISPGYKLVKSFTVLISAPVLSLLRLLRLKNMALIPLNCTI
jgi:hypothetical protein